MGLSFYTCHNCGDVSINDCVRCGEGEGTCDNVWCSTECAEEDGWQSEGGYDPSSEEYYSNCNYCRLEVVEDYELLNYALKKLGLSRDILQKEYLSK